MFAFQFCVQPLQASSSPPDHCSLCVSSQFSPRCVGLLLTSTFSFTGPRLLSWALALHYPGFPPQVTCPDHGLACGGLLEEAHRSPPRSLGLCTECALTERGRRPSQLATSGEMVGGPWRRAHSGASAWEEVSRFWLGQRKEESAS